MAPPDRVPIKRFGGGRLYNTEADTYVSLTDLADMLVNGKRIVAEDAETGENITGDILDLLVPPNRGDGAE
jgi:polyhydroxyalkanoate synthesis regulator protein